MTHQNVRFTWQSITLQLRNPFQVSYGVSETRQAIWLRLANDAGWGEGTIPPYYGVKTEEMVAFWEQAAQRTDPFPDDPEDITDWIGQEGPAPARCALDLALHDRIGRLRGVPLYELLKLPHPKPLYSSFTIGIAAPEEMARQAVQVANYPIIKVKLGSADGADDARLAAIRAARPHAELCVDANGGWTPEEAVRLAESWQDYRLSFIEQPVAKGDIEGMGYVQSHVDVPVVADESVQTLADVERLAAAGVQGINLKLMKLGGLRPALSVLKRAKTLGLRIMLGCMVETSLGTTAMAHLAGMAEWLDLDAPLLIGNDPFVGLRFDDRAQVYLPERAGIGVLQK